MVWNINAPYKAESKKIVWEVAPYLRGQGVDIGAGDFKILPHAISVDNGHHQQFGFQIKPDLLVRSADDLKILGSESMDWVYSSHLLEHMEKPSKALKEWWRLVKPNGYMVLYTPNDTLYPKVGEPGANPDHKHNLNADKILGWVQEVAPHYTVVQNELRNNDDEYSDLIVFKKTMGKGHQTLARKATGPRALVCRFGAFGDLMQASSVFAGLKQQGYHVTLMCSPPGVDVVMHDPNIDGFMLLDKDQIPNGDLGDFWAWQAKKYDKFINLSESVEGTLLSMPGRAQHGWPASVRDQMLNRNYLEFQHEIAGVPHNPQVRFYATAEEKAWAKKERQKLGQGPVILWSLAGSSVHKTWPYMDNIIASVLVTHPTAKVVLVGGPECKILEAGWENEFRVKKTCGEWNIRDSLAFIDECDLIIGPETGVLNAAACLDVTKIVFLSHSTWINLTRDWKNCHVMYSAVTACKLRGANPAQVLACHAMHYSWDHCQKHEESGTAQCQADITAEEVWGVVEAWLRNYDKKVA